MPSDDPTRGNSHTQGSAVLRLMDWKAVSTHLRRRLYSSAAVHVVLVSLCLWRGLIVSSSRAVDPCPVLSLLQFAQKQPLPV